MGVRSKRQRRETQEASRAGARGRVRGALSATARESAVEQSKELVTKMADWGGQVAGAGLTAATAQAASAMGHEASPWVLAGAISVGAAIGGFTSKVINRTIDKLNEASRTAGGAGAAGVGAGSSGGAAAEVMARLSEVLQALEAVSQTVDEALEAVGLAQGRVTQATRGSRNELVRVANAGLRDAPRQLREGQAEVAASSELISEFLVLIAHGHY